MLTRVAADTAPVTPTDLGLTGRQLDVLALMMQGKSNKAIVAS
jgi:DNA-binding CsgD family transcriptional regulator